MARINYLLAGLLGLIAGESYLLLASIRFDFGTYYHAAQAITAGANPYLDTNYRQLPLWAWLLQPIGRLSFESASPIWLALSALALAVSALAIFSAYVWRIDRIRIAWLIAFIASPPALICLFFGQATPFVLLGFALALLLSRREKTFAAGLALSLAMIKPHLALVVLPFLISLPYVAWLGFALGSAAWLALSAAVSPLLLAEFVRRIMFLGTSTLIEERPTLYGLGGSYLPDGTAVNLLLSIIPMVGLIALAMARVKRRPLPLSTEAATAGVVLFLPYVLINDLVLLAPIFFALVMRPARKWLFAIVALCWTLPFLTMYFAELGILISVDGLIVAVLVVAIEVTRREKHRLQDPALGSRNLAGASFP